MKQYPNTPAQRWVEKYSGEPYFHEELGSQTLEEWWHTSKHAKEMLWVAMNAYSPINNLHSKGNILRIVLECSEMVGGNMPDEGKHCLALVRQWLDDHDSVSIEEMGKAAREADAVAIWEAHAAARAVDVAMTEMAHGAYAWAMNAVFAALRAGADPKALADIVRKHIPECPVVLEAEQHVEEESPWRRFDPEDESTWPKSGQDVLASTYREGVGILGFRVQDGYPCFDGEYPDRKVTYWMPIPPAPKGSEEGGDV